MAGYRRQLVDQLVGTTMRLACPVTAEPPALVSWYKDGIEITVAWDRCRVTVVASGSGVARRELSQLRVRNVTDEDAGVYACTATNGFGSVRAFFQVLVHRTYRTNRFAAIAATTWLSVCLSR